MLYSQYRWNTPNIDLEAAAGLSQALSVSPLVGRLLVSRGVHNEKEAERFLHPDLNQMHDPYLLLGMNEAVPRIKLALEREEHILIYGDYDADGVSSTSLMIHLMRHLGASYDIYIPHRSNEGYGLHNHALDWAHQQGVSLIITVDTGISAVEQIAYAATLGIEVIVTDHHEPPEILPEAFTLINPKLPGCPYPFKGLAGAGVALKLAQALIGEVPGEWMEIAAIGTVADLMPLEGENRVIVSYGIESMRGSRLPGVSALLEISGVDQSQVTSINIAFAMAPRINASGRLDHAGRAVSLLTTENLDEAHTLAGQLDLLNRERQQVVEGILQEATAQLEQKIQLRSGSVPDVIVLAGEGWNVGVVGIVASKLLDRYYRPTLILGIDPESGVCKGSARSIEGLDIYEALTVNKHTMDHYGGHPAAAGMTLHRDQLEELEAGLNEFAATVLTEEDFVPQRLADDECRISDVPLKVIQEIDRLQPFGMSNPSPRFVLRSVTVKETRTMGREKRHLKLVLEQDGQQLETVAFGKGALAEFLLPGTVIDVMGELSVNEWNGMRKPQLMLQDIHVPQVQVFDLRGNTEPLNAMKQFLSSLEVHLRYKSGSIGAIVRKETDVSEGNSLYEPCLWVYDRKVGLFPCNAAAQHYGQEQVRTLFVFDTPETPEQLDAMLALFSGAENIILLHGSGNRRDRLQMPSRELFKRIYMQVLKWKAEPVEEQEITPVLSRQCGCSPRMITMMLDVFEELSFITRDNGKIAFVDNPPKRELTASRHYQALESMAETEQVMLDASTPQLTQWMISRMKGVS
ncbi:single-stranded-DNA-specific exonuclease RecJ [Paenibacillus sp. USHLN196]|uniref:single-stranded-DNA-specific exonuclease RecJ n=1 Tax=Paenibacillus sp. USHLN196 TaxID=3081291 RepID=UPI00301879EB